MKQQLPALPPPLIPAPRQQARLSLRFGRRARLGARVDVTAPGLLAIGGMVSAILLSTAVLVHVAVREGKRTS